MPSDRDYFLHRYLLNAATHAANLLLQGVDTVLSSVRWTRSFRSAQARLPTLAISVPEPRS